MWQKFEAYLKFEKQYSSHSLKAYHYDLFHFRDYLVENGIDIFDEAAVKKVKARDIRSWMGKLVHEEISYRSIARKVSVIKSYFRYILQADYIAQNPAKQIKVPAFAHKLPTFLKTTETEALFDEGLFEDSFDGYRDQCAIELLYGCGLRRGELIGLKLQDVDLYQQQLLVRGKGKKERIIPFGKQVAKAIQEYQTQAKLANIELSDTLLIRKDGQPLYPKFVYRMVQKYLSKLNVLSQNSPHVLRHTYATHMLENGADLNAIKELLGHESLAATQVYTHNTIGKLKKVHLQAHPRASTYKSDSL